MLKITKAITHIQHCTVHEVMQMVLIAFSFPFYLLFTFHCKKSVYKGKNVPTTNLSTSPKLNNKNGVTYNNNRSIQLTVAGTATKHCTNIM